VLLPAPFSPTRAITSPARTSKETSESARIEPNRLEMPSMRRYASVSVVPPLVEPTASSSAAPQSAQLRPAIQSFMPCSRA